MKKIDINKMLKENGFNTNEPRKYSDEDRLSLLGIEVTAADNIKNLPFHTVGFDESDYGDINYKVIDLDSLVGINRYIQEKNWLELLFNLHKKRNFELFENLEKFEVYVKSLNESSEELPIVLENSDGQYFVDGNGKHRLTIAKCCGLASFPAIVVKLKPI